VITSDTIVFYCN